MQIKKIFTVLFYTSVLTATAACNSMNSMHSDSGSAKAIAAAESANKAAKKVHYEWRDTGKMIKKAKAAAKAGDEAKAMKLAKKAETQAIDAMAQYKSENKRYSSNY